MNLKNLPCFYILGLLALHSQNTLAAQVTVSVEDNEGHLIENAVVTATPLNLNSLPKPKVKKEIVDQIDKEFFPFIKVVQVNTWINFPNNDDIRHHVYSFSPAKRFELPLYSGTNAPPVLLDHPGVVVLGCNIHDWMIGTIYVSATPYFEKTVANNKTVFKDLPVGDYIMKVWHSNMLVSEESTSKPIKLGAKDNVTIEWRLTLKPEFKIPRQSISTRFSFY